MVHWVQLKESSITEPILQAARSTSQAQSNPDSTDQSCLTPSSHQCTWRSCSSPRLHGAMGDVLSSSDKARNSDCYFFISLQKKKK